MTQDVNIFKEIQNKFKIVEVAQNLGIQVKKVGATYRADSIAPDGGGENALALYTDTNSFYDFKLQVGGDIAKFVATVKFNGDLRAALQELMPEYSNPAFDELLKKKKAFADKVELWHKMLTENSSAAQNAMRYLESRRITQKTIDELKIGISIDNGEFRIYFPYWDDAGKEVIYFTSRRYPNPTENENSPKYKKGSLAYNPFLRNAPLGLNTLKRRGKDGNGTIIITEGMFDFLAFYQEGYSVLCPNGGDFGNNWQEVLEKIGKFNKLILAFDNDDAGREFTYKIAKRLMQEQIPFYCAEVMTKDIAEYYESVGNLQAIINSARPGFEWIIESLKSTENFEDLPFEQQKKKMDECKRVLMQMGETMSASQLHEAMLSVRKYFPREWVANTISEVKKLTTPTAAEKRKAEYMRVVNTIAAMGDIMYHPGTGFYKYNRKDGYWEMVYDEVIGGIIIRLLGDTATGGKLTSILKLLKDDFRIYSDVPVTEFNTKPLLSFKNGTLHIDLKTGDLSLKPHSSIDYNTVTLPYNYDPSAKCDNWIKFIREITNGNEESQSILQEFPGYAVIPDCRFQKCLLLKGSGANGKSVYTEVISEVFGGAGYNGRGYVSFVEPAKFKESFRLMPFRHSFLNISSDTESDLRNGEGTFKKIVAGEFLEDSYKYKDHITFRTRSKLIMCCNEYPSVGDTSTGFMRRFFMVEFPMHYVYKPRPGTNERLLDPNLKEKLFEELPGIMNWILRGMQRLIRQNGFTVKDSKIQDDFVDEFRGRNNHIYVFRKESMSLFFDEEGHGQTLNRRQIYKNYMRWAAESGVMLIPSNKFYGMLRVVFDNSGISVTEKNLMWTIGDNPNAA